MFLAMLLWSTGVFASPLHIDLDHDGVRDLVRITHVPAKPGVELWLSTTGRVTQLRLRGAALTNDVDHDGWPDLFTSVTSSLGAAMRAWKTVGSILPDPPRRKHPGRKGRMKHHAKGRVCDAPDEPQSSVSGGTSQDVGTLNEHSAFSIQLASSACAMPAQCPAEISADAQPRSPRAPPTPQLA